MFRLFLTHTYRLLFFPQRTGFFSEIKKVFFTTKFFLPQRTQRNRKERKRNVIIFSLFCKDVISLRDDIFTKKPHQKHLPSLFLLL